MDMGGHIVMVGAVQEDQRSPNLSNSNDNQKLNKLKERFYLSKAYNISMITVSKAVIRDNTFEIKLCPFRNHDFMTKI